MKKETLKWVIVVGVVLVIAAVLLFGCSGGEDMKAVSEDGKWEAYAMETTVDGQKAWRGAVVYKGEKPEKIKNVRTQVCVNGIKKDFVKRKLKDKGTLGIRKADVGGADQFYLFMKGREAKPASLSVKVKWKEGKKNHVEKLWLIEE